MSATQKCPGCGNEIDPDVCHCGDLMKAHDAYCGHNPVPMGCDCGRCKLPDSLTLDAEIVRTKIQLIELEKDRLKKTKCHDDDLAETISDAERHYEGGTGLPSSQCSQ